MRQQTVSIVISAHNEEVQIGTALQSATWADEIIVVDNESTDKTIEIAKKYTKKIITQKNNPQAIDFQKNIGFTQATSDWILSLDADEQVPDDLQIEIREKIKNVPEHIVGFWIPRKNIIFGKWIQHSLWWPDYQLRLFRKGKGSFPKKSVHEPMTIVGETEKLTNAFVHQNYTSITQFVQKMDTIYTENQAETFVKAGRKIVWLDALRFPARDFLKTFFLQKGYKDGLHGLVLSLLQSFYAFLLFAKIWEKQGFTDVNPPKFHREVMNEMKKIGSEFGYWFQTSMIQETNNPLKRNMYRILRKARKK